MTIPLSELEPRGIYKLWARNLILGVWTGSGWIGIREKFGGLFLDECEVPGDDTTPGSARADEKIGVLPDEIEMRSTGSAVCENCSWEAEFVPNHADRMVPGVWIHKNYNVNCDKVRPISRTYQPLFDYLTSIGGTP